MDDDKIESFFRDMKTADANRAVPPFPEQKQPRKLPLYLYAAAAVIVAVIVMVRYAATPVNTPTTSKTEIVIVVGDDPLESHSLGEYGHEELSEWESPTGFLSEYY